MNHCIVYCLSKHDADESNDMHIRDGLGRCSGPTHETHSFLIPDGDCRRLLGYRLENLWLCRPWFLPRWPAYRSAALNALPLGRHSSFRMQRRNQAVQVKVSSSTRHSGRCTNHSVFSKNSARASFQPQQ